MACYADHSGIRLKDDGSPVTEADEKAEALILRALTSVAPGIPVISEESAGEDRCTDIDGSFWLVDPLDGTKEFISRNGEFTVNIALIERHHPVLGVILAPVLDRLYAGIVGKGAFREDSYRREPIVCR